MGRLKEIGVPLTSRRRANCTPSGGLRANLSTLSSQAPLRPREPSAPVLSPNRIDFIIFKVMVYFKYSRSSRILLYLYVFYKMVPPEKIRVRFVL